MANSVKTRVKLEGFKELEKALSELPKATAKNTLNRALMKMAEPIRDAAQANAPVAAVNGGKLRDGIVISKKSKASGSIRGEIAGLIKKGMERTEAVSKAKSNRAARGGEKTFAQIFVGAASNIREAIPQEFGTENNAPQPYMRPAWDSKKDGALETAKGILWTEIDKAAARLARKKARASR